MKLLTGGPSLDSRLAALVESYPNIAFAVAWAGTGTKTYDALLRHRSRIQHGVIGIHFYQTHPNVLHNFTGSDAVRFVLQPQGVFHPKVYAFWNNDTWEILVGSANLTTGGMGDNAELVLHADSGSGAVRVIRAVGGL